MLELPTQIPDIEVLLALELEELAGNMLLLLRARGEHERRPGFVNMCSFTY